MSTETWDGAERRKAPNLDVLPDGEYHGILGKYDCGYSMSPHPTYTKEIDETVLASEGRLRFNNFAGEVHDGMNGKLYVYAVELVERRQQASQIA